MIQSHLQNGKRLTETDSQTYKTNFKITKKDVIGE